MSVQSSAAIAGDQVEEEDVEEDAEVEHDEVVEADAAEEIADENAHGECTAARGFILPIARAALRSQSNCRASPLHMDRQNSRGYTWQAAGRP